MTDPKTIAEKIVSTVESVLGPDRPGVVPLHIPTFAGNEWDYVKECIDTGWVSSVGAYVDRLEKDLADYTGAKHAIAVSTGTAALHIALMLAGVQAGDEVLCPALTFVATANAVSYCNAVPHFVDVQPMTMGIDANAISAYADEHLEQRDDGYPYNKNTGRRISALIGMHAMGHPFDLDRAQVLCDRLGIPLIEDAAESLGSRYNEQHTGTFGRFGTLSFNGNKIITTGGGGAILTHDDERAAQAKHLTTTGKLKHRYAYLHDTVAYNYRMPNLNAALGCAQLERLDTMIDQKRGLAKRYADAFVDSGFASILAEPEGSRSNYWFPSLVLSPDAGVGLTAVVEALHESGLLVRPLWQPMHKLPMYADCPRMPLPVTEDLAARVISLPGTAGL